MPEGMGLGAVPRRAALAASRRGAQTPSRRGALAMLLVAGGCSPLRLLGAGASVEGLHAERDVAYGPERRQRLDVWRPVTPPGGSAPPRPMVVFFYGGSWRNGDRADYRFVAAALGGAGIITVLPDYRLYPEVTFPRFVEDGAAALAWAAREAPRLGADPRRILVAGHSAGGHIALMLAMDPRFLATAGWDRSRLAGAIALAAPTDFLPSGIASVMEVFPEPTAARNAQPVAFADGSAPPLLLLTGSEDRVVRPRQSQTLAERVTRAGGRATVREYQGLGHPGVLLALTPAFGSRAPVLDDMVRFIRGA